MMYTDAQRISKIIEIATKLKQLIESHTISREQILTNYSIQWMITTPLYNIGEHVYNLSNDFKEKNGGIPWRKISGLRHRLVHDYEGTNWEIITEIALVDIPEFVEQLRKLELS